MHLCSRDIPADQCNLKSNKDISPLHVPHTSPCATQAATHLSMCHTGCHTPLHVPHISLCATQAATHLSMCHTPLHYVPHTSPCATPLHVPHTSPCATHLSMCHTPLHVPHLSMCHTGCSYEGMLLFRPAQEPCLAIRRARQHSHLEP